LIGRGLRTPGPRGVSQVMRQFGVQGYPGFSDRGSERAISDQTDTFPINDYLWRTQSDFRAHSCPNKMAIYIFFRCRLDRYD
jgi:hypothetical protein